MRIRRIGAKSKHSRSSEEALFQEILFQSSQIKRHAAGIYGFGHFLVKARNKIVNIIVNNLEDFGSFEISLPVLQPRSIWENSGRWDIYTRNSQMFHFIGRDGGEYCLAPTGEEIVLDFARENIISYKDMPINIFQIGNKYRDEIRVRGGILRSKEFLMKDAYSFSADFEGMVLEYENMKKCYLKIFSDLSLKTVIVEALSGDIGGKVSEEFMCYSTIGEDTILVDEKNGLYFNIEVLENENYLKQLKDRYADFDVNNFKKVKCLELGHIFQLGQIYSKKMNGYFVDKDNEKKPYFMGCYGIGISRVLGAICANNCDEDGLVWPRAVAPYVCAIIYFNENAKEAEDLYKKLKQQKISVALFDNDATFGSKMKDAKLFGFLYVIILGNKFTNSKFFEVEDRIGGQKLFLKLDELLNFLT